MSLSGLTRSSVKRDHALITPESHVPLQHPAWPGASVISLITPEMGAGFSEYLVNIDQPSKFICSPDGQEYFLLVLKGCLTLTAGTTVKELVIDEFAYLPSGLDWELSSSEARILTFSKIYQPCNGVAAPNFFTESLDNVKALPFLGDTGALLQTLVPEHLSFDWGINVFEFLPGSTLPQVETHWMEHGLYILQGEGVYRLGDNWYNVLQGDAIWMKPYLLQWFAATGKTPTKYIYYKEMNRAPSY